MRILLALLPLTLVAGAPAAAQTFKPAVVDADISPLETLWHVRVALNVAALGCRDADEATTVAAYNSLIRRNSAALTAANAAVDARYKAQYGAKWQDARERDMTKLYNFFAQPPAQAAFCATAKDVLAQIGTVDQGALMAFAKAELPVLEAPFWSSSPQDQFAGGPASTTVVAVSAAVPIAPRGF
ncbi:hypothetical protein FPZ24_00545 [Sphingomonas panacisoli]|uniref:Uncharacterized protein n=1 Tax=Sphingomonas panacisoli TaxID=1813879 RepID=A0A5B8LEH1_9SPHN|nr:hypothetical protein [Sphingomonas panacisoli]QDZ06144.1 hypothetical protein FPZ24_00545 [Sphingomonas panacisoli]